MIIDAKNQIVGRIATFAAKQALLGQKVDIINSEDAIMTGSKENIQAKYKERRKKGGPHHGPYYARLPDRIVRRIIRGMLPYKQERGKKAFARVMCYIGTPKDVEGQQTKVPGADYTKLRTAQYLTIQKIAAFMDNRKTHK